MYFKTIGLALLGKLAKGHEKEIAKAQKWIDSAQSAFASALEEASISEAKVDVVIADAEAKIAELQKIVADARSKKEQAVAFKKKIESFLN